MINVHSESVACNSVNDSPQKLMSTKDHEILKFDVRKISFEESMEAYVLELEKHYFSQSSEALKARRNMQRLIKKTHFICW